MRTTTIACAFALLLVARPAFAQEWFTYTNVADSFEVYVPTQPKVAESTWKTQTGFTMPARIYTFEHGKNLYTVTVVDYSSAPEQGKKRSVSCPAVDANCVGSNLSGDGYWMHDVRGAMLHAAASILKRDVKLTEMSWNQITSISSILVQAQSNRDQSMTYAVITMHENLLYVAEGTVPKGSPAPAIFAGSFGVLARGSDRAPRYPTLYSHEIHGFREAPIPSGERRMVVPGRPAGQAGN
jgi:hypothetical protein